MMPITRDYLHEDLCYRDIHRDGKAYYQHEAGDPCDPDLLRLFSWDLMVPGGSLFLATMAQQPMGWTTTIKQSEWQRERDSVFAVDDRGCYVESLVPPGLSQRVNLRIFIREEILREELTAAGLAISRFECFAPPNDPGDRTFLVEARREEDSR